MIEELLDNILEGTKDARTLFVDTGKVPEDIFNNFVRGDPSHKGKYVEWMCKQYTIDTSRPQHIIDVVRLFDQHVQKKKIKQMDIYQYETLEELEREIENAEREYIVTKKKKGIGKGKTQNYEDFSDDNWLIYSPKDYEASKWITVHVFGIPLEAEKRKKLDLTGWCVGYSRSHWEDYMNRGKKLYYVMNKKDEDEKYAVEVFLGGKIQVWDKQDRVISTEKFEKIFGVK